jgi:hypothetical protein
MYEISVLVEPEFTLSDSDMLKLAEIFETI